MKNNIENNEEIVMKINIEDIESRGYKIIKIKNINMKYNKDIINIYLKK